MVRQIDITTCDIFPWIDGLLWTIQQGLLLYAQFQGIGYIRNSLLMSSWSLIVLFSMSVFAFGTCPPRELSSTPTWESGLKSYKAMWGDTLTVELGCCIAYKLRCWQHSCPIRLMISCEPVEGMFDYLVGSHSLSFCFLFGSLWFYFPYFLLGICRLDDSSFRTFRKSFCGPENLL